MNAPSVTQTMPHPADLTLRPLNTGDADFLYTLYNDPLFKQNIGDRGIHSVHDAQQMIADKHALSVQGIPCFQVICEQQDTALGMLTLLQRDYLQVPDIGYALLPAARGKGIAKLAARQLVNACQLQGITTVSAIVSPENTASCTLLESLGFHSHGLLQIDCPSRVYSRQCVD